jgi:Kdo2-lipid IVA lauroyltransferase/acyltransferase
MGDGQGLGGLMALDVNTSAPADAGPVDRPATLGDRLGYAALRGVAAIARRMPVEWSTAAWAAVAQLIGPRLRQHRRALENLAVAFPDKSAADHEAIARAMWAHMGRTFAETLMLDRIIADPARLQVVDPARWEARMSDPVPSVGCTLHMGNWELAIWPLNRFGRNPAGIYKPLANPLIDRWLAATRAGLFPGGLLSKGDNADDGKGSQATARQLIGIARKGGCIGFVCDHVDRRRGTPITFMGRQAKFTVAPALITRHVGARIWVGRCLRIGAESRFRIETCELDVPQTGDKSADAATLTTAMFAVFETWIRDTPEQWMWWNTRWLGDEGGSLA